MEKNLEQRVDELEKKVAELEGRVPVQPSAGELIKEELELQAARKLRVDFLTNQS